MEYEVFGKVAIALGVGYREDRKLYTILQLEFAIKILRKNKFN